MGRAAYCLPLALLFLASAIPSKAQMGAAGADETRVTVAAGAPLTVECRLRPEQPAEWQRDGAAPPPDLRVAPEAAADARLATRLTAPAAHAHHAGLYTCSRARDHRVRVVVLPAGEVTSAGVPVSAGVSEAPPAGDAQLHVFDVRGNISLWCTLSNPNSLAYTWTKNNTDIKRLDELKNRYKLEQNGAYFVVARSVEDDFGNYTCAVGSDVQRWELRGRPHLKLPANTNVVEGQKLKISCKVIGKPYPRVFWQYSNDTEHFVDVAEALGGRVVLAPSEQGVPDGTLTLAAAERADAGTYRCAAATATVASDTTLRVKDMYAALWPFLGICAEVFVLCAIILVYERRRTKPDMDDSDVDNNDQKKS